MPKAAIGLVVLYVLRIAGAGLVAATGARESPIAGVIAAALMVALVIFSRGGALGRRVVLFVEGALLLVALATGALAAQRGGAFGEVMMVVALVLLVGAIIGLRLVTRPSIAAWNASRSEDTRAS